MEPNESGKGYEFVNAVVGGAIPKEYIPAVDAGIQGAMQSGVLAGYNVVDVKVTLFDGSYHEVDSSEMAFKIAGSMAFKEACRKRDPVILEPIMKVSIVVPDEYTGDVIGDVSARRGSILGMEPRNGATQIDANVPLLPCSATPRISEAEPRAAASIPWSPATISNCQVAAGGDHLQALQGLNSSCHQRGFRV